MRKSKKNHKVKQHSGSATQPSKKNDYSAREIAKAWQSFKPKIPLSYTLASREEARIKNSY